MRFITQYTLLDVNTWRSDEQVTDNVQVFTDESEALAAYHKAQSEWHSYGFRVTDIWDAGENLNTEATGILHQRRYERRDNNNGRRDIGFLILRANLLGIND